MKSIYTYYKERLIEIGGRNRSLYIRFLGKKTGYDVGRLFSRDETLAWDRLSAGEQTQIEIFGENMRGFADKGKENGFINRWLVDNCFGDYYTRGGLDYRQRELITFCFLAAQGGCEPQLKSHAAANMRVGNDRDFLVKAVSQCVPYIGYPRCLNALRCVNEAAKITEG